MEGRLTFTIGKGFGQMLQRIAWEKLTEKYNPREAVEIITKSLPGCTEGMAVDILDGKIILGEDEATQEVLGTPRRGREVRQMDQNNASRTGGRGDGVGRNARRAPADHRGRWW